MHLLTVCVSHRTKSAQTGHCHSFVLRVPSVQYVKNRFHYVIRRQLLMNFEVDADDTLQVRYRWPMTMRWALTIVESIPTSPNKGYSSYLPEYV